MNLSSSVVTNAEVGPDCTALRLEDHTVSYQQLDQDVHPREVEEVMHEHPAVAEVAVIGLPRPNLAEEVGAAVVLRPGASATAEEEREHVERQVAAYKYPRKVWIVDTLPKNPTGKIVKREIVPPADLGGRRP